MLRIRIYCTRNVYDNRHGNEKHVRICVVKPSLHILAIIHVKVDSTKEMAFGS